MALALCTLAGFSPDLFAREQSAALHSATHTREALVETIQRHGADLRTISFAGSDLVMLVWNEPDSIIPGRYAISRDGRNIDQVALTENLIRLRYQTFDPLVETPRISPDLSARKGRDLFLVQFIGTPLQEMRAEITALGGDALRFLTDNTHIMRLDPGALDAVRNLPYIRWVGPYHPAYRLDEQILIEMKTGAADGAPLRYNIEVLERGPAARQRVTDAIAATGGIVDHAPANTRRMEATLTLAQVAALAHHRDVNFIEHWRPPGKTVDLARQMSGAVPFLSDLDFHGQGVRGEVMDGGIQMDHPEWRATPILHGPVNSTGLRHGTNVYGILFSRGLNPDAQGFLSQHEAGIFGHFRALVQGSLSRPAWHLESVDPAGPFRVVFQNNSWGHLNAASYDTVSAELDDAVFQSDLLVVQSQGNHGTREGASQAWSKNVISVGGVGHFNSLDPLVHQRSGASIGPATDGRVKPDLAHFYGSVRTTTSGSSYTETFGGTSAAAPLTSGSAGLLMQMWHEGVFDGHGGASTVFDSRPHFATAKAMLIASAFRYTWVDGTVPNQTLTRDVQGWGVANAGNLHSINADSGVFIVDGTDPVDNASSRQYLVGVLPGQSELLITMAYNDPPGNPSAAHARVNDLDLRVTSPRGDLYLGNHGLRDGNWSQPVDPGSALPDTVDTVESVFVKEPEPGTWTIEIFGSQVIEDAVPSQPGVQANFGLAVLGATEGPAPSLLMSLADPLPDFLAPGRQNALTIEVVPYTQSLQPGSVQLHLRTDPQSSFDTFPLVDIGQHQHRALIPHLSCSNEPEFYFSARDDTGATILLPHRAPGRTYRVQVGTVEEHVLLQANFEQTLPAEWSATGLWHISSGRCIPGGLCINDSWAYYGRHGACNYSTGGQTHGLLTAPEIQLPERLPGGRLLLTFCSALETENAPMFDKAEVFVNQDMVLRVPESQSWTHQQIDLSDYAGQNITVAWSFDSVDGNSNNYRGWHVDNIRIVADVAVCEDHCYANCDGSTTEPILTVDDFTCFINAFAFAQTLPHQQQVEHYANCDGRTNPPVLTVDDFTCFINAFAQGCP